jgi:CRISPR-associated protein Cas4
MEKQKIISVSDINTWLYCARKLFLVKVCGLKVSMNRNMAIGRIKHSILERFSKSEEALVSSITSDLDKLDMVFMYEDFIRQSANSVFIENMTMIEKFLIDKDDILKKVLRDFNEDIKLRVVSIKSALAGGFFGKDIWKNLDCMYISELSLESENLGLRGRVDRVQISKNAQDNPIIPYELKSREDKIFRSDELQLTAYAMLLEDFYKQQVKKGIVEVGNKRQEIEITDNNKKEVLQIVEQIRNFSNPDAPVPPIQSNFNKCRFCEFQEECSKL